MINSKNIQLFVSIIFFILSIGLFLFIYREVHQNKIKKEELGVNLATEIKRQDDIKSLERSIELIKEDKILLETHFAESRDVVPFLNSIESIARKTGVKAEVTSVDVSKDSSTLVVGIRSLASFESLYKFLILLENSPYETSFTLVSMQKESNAQNTEEGTEIQKAKWQMNLNIKLLSFIK
ncbi:MAG: hypothetical protein AAB510_03040 [Patescibacteria group bacterium]